MYGELKLAAARGKPGCLKACRVIQQTERFMLKACAETGTPCDKELLDESLAQLIVYSNPWLELDIKQTKQ